MKSKIQNLVDQLNKNIKPLSKEKYSKLLKEGRVHKLPKSLKLVLNKLCK